MIKNAHTQKTGEKNIKQKKKPRGAPHETRPLWSLNPSRSPREPHTKSEIEPLRSQRNGTPHPKSGAYRNSQFT